MSQKTINRLKEDNMSLYGFKGIVTSNPNSTPTIWFKLSPSDPEFATATNISWSTPLYIGQCAIGASPGGPIIKGKSPWPGLPGKEISLGKKYTYNDSGWEQEPTNGSTDSFTIQNHVDKGFTTYYVGSKLVRTGKESSIIAVDGYPDGEIKFTPIETVAFIFTQEEYNAGTLIVKAFSGGAMVTFVGADNKAIITYDPENEGWESIDIPGSAEFKKFKSGTPLYKEMTKFSHNALKKATDQLECLLLSQKKTLAALDFQLRPAESEESALAALDVQPCSAESEESGWCECKDGKVERNKCKEGYKPKCVKGDYKEGYKPKSLEGHDCNCVQK